MLATQERTIDGDVYAVTMIPAFQQIKMMHRVGRGLAPAVVTFLGSIADGGLANTDVGAFGRVTEILFEKLSAEDIVSITKELLAASTVNGKPLLGQFDIHFRGRMMTWAKVLAFSLEVNYSDFFGVLRERVSFAGLAASLSGGSKT